jgi:hypothetical protein
MNVEIGTEATQFPEKENINGIFLAVCNTANDIFETSYCRVTDLPEVLTHVQFISI